MRSLSLSQRLFLVLLAALTVLCTAACDEPLTTPTAGTGTISQLSLMPAAVVAGASSEGTVTLREPAPRAGTEVQLSSSDGVAVVPPTILVPARAVGATFTVRTRVVAADTIATISASVGGQKRDTILSVTAPIARPPALQALEVEPSVLTGGQTARGTIRLTGAALTAMVVTVRSNNAVATVPASVTVPAGAASATFTVTTRPISLDTQFDITASFADQTRSVQIRLTP